MINLSFKLVFGLWVFGLWARVIYGLFECGQGVKPISNGRMALLQLGSWVGRVWGGIRLLAAEKGARGQLGNCSDLEL